MNIVDLVLVVAMLVFAWLGWRRGFVYGLLSLIGFLVGAAGGLCGAWRSHRPARCGAGWRAAGRSALARRRY